MKKKIDPWLAATICVVLVVMLGAALIKPELVLPLLIPSLTTIFASLRGKLVDDAKE